MSDSLESYIHSVRDSFESTLGAWVRIPTVSAIPEHGDDIVLGAKTAADYLRSLGAEAEVISTAGHPVVLGSLMSDPSNRTVLIYNHLDVQPANEPEWLSDPFVMCIDDGTYRGRGTTDDKGPALTALLAARFAVGAGVPINVKFVWEFEEEIGSPNFDSFVSDRVEDLRADSVVISDTIWLSRERPAIPFGLRGLISARLVLETGTKDVHSGLTGGAARNPLSELCAVLVSCHDVASGQLHIPGFYDDVRQVSSEELAGYEDSGFSTEVFRRAHELKMLQSTDPSVLMRRIWTEPTFEIHGISGGYHGPGVKTAIPARAEAKISMRLVPDQSPENVFELLRRFVATLNPDVQVIRDSALAPFLGPRTGPYTDAAVAAVQSAFGVRPAAVREGGSIGAVVTLHDRLRVPILFLGLSLPEHGYHAPNENFDWGQASGGMKMFVRYFENISGL